MRGIRAAVGVLAAAATTMAGILGAMWVVATLLGDIGILVAIGAYVFLVMALGGLGLFVGYRIYFALTRPG